MVLVGSQCIVLLGTSMVLVGALYGPGRCCVWS